MNSDAGMADHWVIISSDGSTGDKAAFSRATTLATLNAALAGRYTIEGEIGAGGTATVDLANHVRHKRHVAVLSTMRLVVACAALTSSLRAQAAPTSQGPTGARSGFWASLTSLCGRAFAGRVTEGNASDSLMRRAALVMHVRSCTADEIRIPFHVDSNRSRTWVLTRTAAGLRLKHDHRHADGTEDAVTQYGGDTKDSGSVTRQEFPADAQTATLIPAARTNVWTVEVVPGQHFAYALRREGTDRRFRVEFDLTKPIAPPPPPWGANP